MSGIQIAVAPLIVGATATVTVTAPTGWTIATITATGATLSGSGLTSPAVRTYAAPSGAVTITVTGTDAQGQAVSRSVTVTAQAAAPTNTVAPSISGTATVGQTLTATEGTWTGAPTVTLQWLRGSTAISGATGLTYVLVEADLGATISVRATATNAGGSAQAASAGVGPVEAGGAVVVPDAFGASDWDFTPAAATGQATLTVATVPSGATAIDYTFDGGATVHTLWRATPGARNIPRLTPGSNQSCRVRARNSAGSSAWSTPKTATAGAVFGATLAAVSIAPTARYWAGAEGNTIDTGTGVPRVTTLVDLAGSYPMAADVAVCPELRTDPFGRKMLHMANSEQSDRVGLRNTSMALDPTNITVIAVMRQGGTTSSRLVVTDSEGTQFGLLGSGTSNGTMVVNNSSGGSYTSNRYFNQALCVMSARATKTGSTYNNSGGCNGRYDSFTASVTTTSGTGIGLQCKGSADFQVYEVLVYNRNMSQAEVNTVTAELCAHYGVTGLDNICVFEGDSITFGSGGGRLYSPSAQVALNEFLPSGWRVQNFGTSGHTIANITSELGSNDNWSNAWTEVRATGRRVLVLQIGRNNAGDANQDAVRSAYASYLTAANGPLARGWDVIVLANIGAAAATADNNLHALRTWLESEDFLAAVEAGPGQIYEGRVQCRSVYLATAPDNSQPFAKRPTDVSGSWYYDGTHITEAGSGLMVSGGLTPEHGAVYDIV